MLDLFLLLIESSLKRVSHWSWAPLMNECIQMSRSFRCEIIDFGDILASHFALDIFDYWSLLITHACIQRWSLGYNLTLLQWNILTTILPKGLDLPLFQGHLLEISYLLFIEHCQYNQITDRFGSCACEWFQEVSNKVYFVILFSSLFPWSERVRNHFCFNS